MAGRLGSPAAVTKGGGSMDAALAAAAALAGVIGAASLMMSALRRLPARRLVVDQDGRFLIEWCGAMRPFVPQWLTRFVLVLEGDGARVTLWCDQVDAPGWRRLCAHARWQPVGGARAPRPPCKRGLHDEDQRRAPRAELPLFDPVSSIPEPQRLESGCQRATR